MFFPNNLHEGFILRSTIYKYFCSTSPEANTNGGDHLCFQEADGLVTFSFSFTHSRGSSPHFGGPCKSCPSSCDFSPEALRSAAFATGQYPPPWVFWQHGKLIRTIEINSLPLKHILFPLSLVSNALLFSSHSGFHLWGSKQSPYIADFISLGKHLHPFVLAFCPLEPPPVNTAGPHCGWMYASMWERDGSEGYSSFVGRCWDYLVFLYC